MRAWLKCVGGPLLVSRSTLTNDHKLGGLTQQKCPLSQLRRSLKSRCWQGYAEALGENHAQPFPAPRRTWHSLPVIASLQSPSLPGFLLCVCLRVSSLLHIKTPVIAFRA